MADISNLGATNANLQTDMNKTSETFQKILDMNHSKTELSLDAKNYLNSAEQNNTKTAPSNSSLDAQNFEKFQDGNTSMFPSAPADHGALDE